MPLYTSPSAWARYYYNLFKYPVENPYLNGVLDLHANYPITNIKLDNKWEMLEFAGIDYFIISKGKNE